MCWVGCNSWRFSGTVSINLVELDLGGGGGGGGGGGALCTAILSPSLSLLPSPFYQL